jgi:protein required for attachment to host cells
MSNIWVVVADSSRARIFSAEKPASQLVEIETLAHPQARLHESDLVSDRSGRDRNPGSMSHGMGNEAETKNEESIRFAIQVNETLDSGRNRGKFGKLYVIAAPEFLGTLRKHRSSPLEKLIAGEVAKNLAAHNMDEIRKNLPLHL